MPPNKPEPFADRVRGLREKRGWSQTELAERADLAPAALSRILTGEREPRMEHIIALASALETSLTELVAGTTAAGTVLDWVPRQRFEESERLRVETIGERDIAKADAAARCAESGSLKRTLAELNARLEGLEQKLALAEIDARTARQQRQELAQLRQRAATLEAECERLGTQARELSAVLSASRAEAAQFRQLWEETRAQSKQLHSELSTAKGGQFLTGAMGLFLGAVLSDPPKRRRS